MADIFISYSKQEAELTVTLARELERRGYTTWWDSSLQPGDEFRERITNELDSAKVVIVIWTERSVTSRWVQAEAQWADAQNKLITLRSGDLHPDRIPLPFNTRHTDLVTDLEKIYAALLRYDLLPPFHFEHANQGSKIGAFRRSDGTHGYGNTWRNRLVNAFAAPGRRTLGRTFVFHKLYIAFGGVVAALSVGMVQLLQISRSLNETIVNLLEPHSVGVVLQGRYLYPNYVLIFGIILIFIVLLIVSTLTAAYIKRCYASDGPELTNLRQDADDIIRYANNITGYIYGGEKDLPRFDIIELSARHHIASNGDTVVSAMFEIHCSTDAAHFWKYWIDADAESHPMTSLRQLNFEVVDVETSQKLDWLPTSSDSRHKVFAIFFPEVKPGERKRLRISYFWPGYMKKLTDLGATGFDWSYRSQHPEIRGRFRKEWVFDTSVRAVRCRQTGRQSKSASLRFVEQKSNSRWVYEDANAIMDGTKFAVEFSLTES